MLVCDCGNWMHTEGVDEVWQESSPPLWLVRCECRRCQRHVGGLGAPDETVRLVDRLMWSDDARHTLERLPPYLQPLVEEEAESFARSHGERVITSAVLSRARNGGVVTWDPDAEQRLDKVPAAVRAMARQELERTALDLDEGRVTVALMERVKARYFGMFSKSNDE
ncbi:PCP reductase family protein [Candidatus Nitrospira bockiana]